MLHPPEDLDETVLAAALTREWGVVAAEMTYRPLGFGSHHWSVVDRAGHAWFATVDDLDRKRLSGQETHDSAYARLRSSLDAARGLRDTGATFVVAPVTTAGDEPLARLGPRLALSLFPLVTGDSFGFGEYDGDGHRQAVLEMLLGVHGAPAHVRDRAPADDQAVQHRDALEAAIGDAGFPDTGPYARRVADLFAENRRPIRRVLQRYDDLAAGVDPARAVLTHGEPHSGNTMRTPDGWRLIDWDTALVSQPERDLWILGADVQRAYTAATGVPLQPELLEMYRLRWDIVDVTIVADRFRSSHAGTADDAQSWSILQRVVTGLPR
ncbi:MAG TPA: phosphotransferase [Actinoplanes sp.]|nr:phosphotransferase [Actinoplanes sp.]